MSKEDKINIEEVFVFPHVRYVTSDDNPNPTYIYKKYIGNHESLTNGKVYQFHQAMFSPSKEITHLHLRIAYNKLNQNRDE